MDALTTQKRFRRKEAHCIKRQTLKCSVGGSGRLCDLQLSIALQIRFVSVKMNGELKVAKHFTQRMVKEVICILLTKTVMMTVYFTEI